VIGQFVNIDPAIGKDATVSIDIANARIGGDNAFQTFSRVLLTLDIVSRLTRLIAVAGPREAERGECNYLLYAKNAHIPYGADDFGGHICPDPRTRRIVRSLVLARQCIAAFHKPLRRIFMKRLLLSICLALSFFISPLASADEGMWLYNEAPKDRIKTKYGFQLTQQWLDHVRLSSVRFNNGGSGSFVSADGLTFTNHHVGAACVQQLSSEGHDYIKTGFYARTQAEERRCPNLELNELVGIEDVTDKVNAGVKAEMSAADAGQAHASGAAMSLGVRCGGRLRLSCIGG